MIWAACPAMPGYPAAGGSSISTTLGTHLFFPVLCPVGYVCLSFPTCLTPFLPPSLLSFLPPSSLPCSFLFPLFLVEHSHLGVQEKMYGGGTSEALYYVKMPLLLFYLIDSSSCHRILYNFPSEIWRYFSFGFCCSQFPKLLLTKIWSHF